METSNAAVRQRGDSPTTRRVVVTDAPFEDLNGERAVARHHEAKFEVFQCKSEQEAVAAVAGADVVMVTHMQVTSAVLEALAPNAVVVRYGVGVDNIDIDRAHQLGVRVACVPDYGSETVADHASAAILSLMRRLPMYDKAVRDEGWPDLATFAPIPDLSRSTVGLVGWGRIGQAVHARLAAFGFSFLAHAPGADQEEAERKGVELVGLDELLAKADAVTLHVPLLPSTRHLISAQTLGLMKVNAVLVNTARGGLIDSAALDAALRAGTIAGAALDVFEEEPLPEESPLRSAPNLLLTPHAAFYSDDSLARLQRSAADELDRALAGRPLRCPVLPRSVS